MPFLDLQIEKLYYSISEVADILQVNQSLIRFWEKEFPQLSPRKNHRGNRQFTKKDIDLLRRILFLTKEKGYTLEGAKKSLRSKINDDEKPNVVERLVQIRNSLNALAAQF